MTEGAVTDDPGVFFISMQFKGQSYPVPLEAQDDVGSIFSFASEVLDFQPEHCKLIYKGKRLLPEQPVCDTQLGEGAKVMLVATAASDIAYVQSQRADPLVKGFEEEERDERNRRKRARAAQVSAWGTKQDQQYRFRSIKPEFKYHTPTPFDAQKLLEKLATDPGIIEIMTTRKFEVGILTEMSPEEAKARMMAKGEADKDLLGYNQNAGEMIVVKLRTDNVKGFRPYHDLINTLIHELTHNVWGPHDHNFWKLFGELKAQYMKFHRFWSHGGNSTSGTGARFDGFDDDKDDNTGSFGHVLGGASASSVDPKLARQMFLDQAEASFSAICSCCGQPAPSADEFCGSCGPSSTQQEKNGAGPDISTTVMEADTSKTEEMELDTVMEADTSKTEEADTVMEDAASKADVEMPSAEMELDGAKAERPEHHLSPPDASGDPSTSIEATLDTSAETNLDLTGAVASGSDAPGIPQDSKTNDVGPTAAENQEGAGSNQGAGPAAPDLELADLEGCGLDGTMLWLQRFRTHLEKLGAVQPKGRAAAEIMLRLVRNVLEHPYDEKFRKIRADNPKIQAALLDGAFKEFSEAMMAQLGFEKTTDSSAGSYFVLGDKGYDCVKLQMGKELLESHLEH